MKLSAETRLKMSNSRKGMRFSESHRRHISEATKGRISCMKGKHHTFETKNKLRLSMKGKGLGLQHIKEHRNAVFEEAGNF